MNIYHFWRLPLLLFLFLYPLIASQAQAQNGQIIGRLYQDGNNNCSDDVSDVGLGSVIISARDQQNNLFYSSTDSTGFYSFNLPAGTYSLSAHLPYDGLYFGFCSPALPSVVGIGTVDTNSIGLITRSSGSIIRAELAASRLDPCHKGILSIGQTNVGSIAPGNYSIELQLDPQLSFDSIINGNNLLSFSPTGQQTLRFELFNQSNVQQLAPPLLSFSVNVSCDALPNQVFYNKIRVLNDSLVSQPAWSDAIAEINDSCITDTLIFTLKNKGTGAQTPIQYWVIEDNIMLRQGSISLQPNQSSQIRVAQQQGKSYRLEAINPPAVPMILADSSSYNVPDCDSLRSLNNFVRWFPLVENTPFVDNEFTELGENSGDFYLSANPLGYDSLHLVRSGDWIEYTVHFRNSQGNTVSDIDIIDSLPAEVEISSLQLGAASHPYAFRLNDNRVLNFHIYNANLTDSSNSYPHSLGFVSFRVKTKDGLPAGTRINQRAHILYDINFAYYHTEEIFHHIGSNFIRVLSDRRLTREEQELQVYPNPFREQISFATVGQIGDMELLIYDALGRTVHYQRQDLTDKLVWQCGQLPKGAYFYQLRLNGQWAGSGKIISE